MAMAAATGAAISAGRVVGAVAVAGAACVAWGFVEAHRFTVRRANVPVLPAGASPLTVLHVSDLHLTPRQRDKVAWVRSLADEDVDLVVTTGDNIAHVDAVEPLAEAFAPFAGTPGVFVFGSNDYNGPKPINPFKYFAGPSRLSARPRTLPTDALRAALGALGWVDLNNGRARVSVGGSDLTVVGLDDPHIGLDAMPPDDPEIGDVRLGVVHAPYERAVGALMDDGARVVFAGHTHGGQVCVPGFGALVTNCDLPRAMAKGLHHWPASTSDTWLHVSAGLGTSPYAPVRFACRPEATILTLVPAS